MANDISELPGLAASVQGKLDAIATSKAALVAARGKVEDTQKAQAVIVEKAKADAAAVVAAEQANVDKAAAAYQMAVDDLKATTSQIDDLMATVRPSDDDTAASVVAEPAQVVAAPAKAG